MAIIINDDGIEMLKDALRSNASDRERNNAIAQLDEAAETGLPDEIDLYRVIRDSGARKRIDIARAVLKFFEEKR